MTDEILDLYIARGRKHRRDGDGYRVTATEHKVRLSNIRAVLKPCPFCGRKPTLLPTHPWHEGNAFGEVRCTYGRCPARPVVRDGSQVADERGSFAYVALAAKRWNRRVCL